MRAIIRWGLAALLVASASQSVPRARELTFDDRVRAQQAIERVRHMHRVGSSLPFEEAVTRDLLERKVRTYLRQTVVLEEHWATRVTDEMLSRELERMAAGTRMPERLGELFAALDHDPLVIRECLARPALVDRLARNFFARDARIHGEARRRAEDLQAALVRGDVDPGREHPRRTAVALVLDEMAQASVLRRALTVSADEFEDWRERLDGWNDGIAPVVEEEDAFVVRVALENGDTRIALALFAVPKVTWDDWWAVAGEGFNERRFRTDTGAGGGLPEIAGRTVRQPYNVMGNAPCVPDDTWDDAIDSGVPDGRRSHTAVWTGSRMLVWGGSRPGAGDTNTGASYDPATDTWARISNQNAPSPRAFHTAVWTGSLMVIWGGHQSNRGGRYDPVNDTWQSTSLVDAPSPRDAHTAVWTGDRMIVWGGGEATFHDFFPLRTGGTYDPQQDSWTPTSLTNAPSERYDHVAVWTGTRMVVWGGGYPGSSTATGGQYDPATDSWTATAIEGAPAARSYAAAAWTGSHMVVWGGSGVNDGGRYDPFADTWAPISLVDAPSVHTQPTAVWTGSEMIFWGGGTATEYDTGGRYDPVADTWRATSTVNAPSPRQQHAAVWTGERMIVWGGSSVDTGGRYDPVSDSWTPTAIGAVSGRENHTMVWTGTELIVWGGGPFNELTASGERYDPALDTWTATSLTDAPSPRYLHTTVWTGDRMIVWGGLVHSPSYGGVDTGGRYDPVTDSWQPTSTVDAPSARYFHAAVWTGSEMVIWGGGPTITSGGRYDPRTDTWAPTALTGAPSGRNSPTAVWTGTRMIVWGGDGGDYTNTGGHYDPAADTWVPTPLDGAPAGRASHTAVWTGRRMLIWGGFGNEFDPLADGAAYDPSTGSWTPLSTLQDIATPTARYGHTVVWTGEVMIVWGGRGDRPLNSGGRYDPATDRWTPTSLVDAPTPRNDHGAIWADGFMLVWGGDYGSASGGSYAFGHSIDGDGDGVSECDGDCMDSNPAVHPAATEICDGINDDCADAAWPSVPPDEIDDDGDGFVECVSWVGGGSVVAGGDCDDAIPEIWPGAPETNDGADNQCPGDAGHGLVDEISGRAGFSDDGDGSTFSWPPQSGATLYTVARSTQPDFHGDCRLSDSGAPSWVDPETPPDGVSFFYLVRPIAPNPGSWGQDSSGDERTAVCPDGA